LTNKVLTPDGSVGEQLFERRADLSLIAVALRGVEVPEAHLDRGLGGAAGVLIVGEQRPKPEGRNLTAAVVQG
jgi:hypothetical protein